MGSLDLPFDTFCGIRILGARRDVPTSGTPIRRVPDLLRALALAKRAAAQANRRLGHLSEAKAAVIAQAWHRRGRGGLPAAARGGHGRADGARGRSGL